MTPVRTVTRVTLIIINGAGRVSEFVYSFVCLTATRPMLGFQFRVKNLLHQVVQISLFFNP